MASASDILRRLTEAVKCCVCFLILDNPKSLPCGHTFCLGCIQRAAGIWDDDVNDDRAVSVTCPLCRQPFRTSLSTMPVNFVALNVIAALFQSSEGMCQVCFKQKSLELATTKCQDCNEDLCDSCSTRECEVMAQYLTEMLLQDVERLVCCRVSLQSAQLLIADLKGTYERHQLDLRSFVNSSSTEQQLSLQDVDTYITSKLDALNEIMERSNSCGEVDHDQLTSLIQCVGHLLAAIIEKLNADEEKLEEILGNIDELENRASDIINSGSTSRNNRETIDLVHDYINLLLTHSTVEEYHHPTTSDNETAALSLLSGRCHDNLEELLRQVAASSDLLRQPVYERSAAENEQSRQDEATSGPSPPFVKPKTPAGSSSRPPPPPVRPKPTRRPNEDGVSSLLRPRTLRPNRRGPVSPLIQELTQRCQQRAAQIQADEATGIQT